MSDIITTRMPPSLLSDAHGYAVPAILQHAGPTTLKAFLTFFTDQIRNPHTREAYHRNAVSFFDWCQQQRLTIQTIESFHVAAYVEQLCQRSCGVDRAARPVDIRCLDHTTQACQVASNIALEFTRDLDLQLHHRL